MLDDRYDNTRNQPEQGSPNMGPAGKFTNRAGAAKAAPGMPGQPPSEPRPPAVTSRPRLELSLTQILGSTGAAVTAAFLGSRLGVAGTLIGAALASIISVVGGAIYTTSIKATRHRVALAIGAARGPDERQEQDVCSPSTAPVPVVHTAPRTARQPAVPLRAPAPRIGRRPALRGVLVGSALAAAIFVAAITLITGYETVSGTALAGGQAGGLTVLGGRHVDIRPETTPAKTSGVTSGSTADRSSTTTVGSAKTEPTAPAGSITRPSEEVPAGPNGPAKTVPTLTVPTLPMPTQTSATTQTTAPTQTTVPTTTTASDSPAAGTTAPGAGATAAPATSHSGSPSTTSPPTSGPAMAGPVTATQADRGPGSATAH